MNFALYLTFQEFFKSYALYIAFGLAGVVFITVLVFFLISLSKRKKEAIKPQPVAVNKSEILEALGGKDNIVSKQIAGSRVAVVLKDYSLINEAQLKEVGVASFIKMSNKITLVIKGDSSSFFKALD